MQIPKIEYDVYYKNKFNEQLIKVNISICDSSKISLLIPLKLSGNIDIFNTSSGYYNDICYTATSDSGTDILLSDRKQEFIDNNKTVCQEDCEFTEYDIIKEKVKCVCKVKETPLSIGDMNIDKKKLYNNFIDLNNIANISILRCVKKLFTKIGLIKNIGNYILIIMILYHLLSFIIFFVNQIKWNKKKIYLKLNMLYLITT